MKDMYGNTRKFYNIGMWLWTKGIGGGSGDPENYCDFETCSSDFFA